MQANFNPFVNNVLIPVYEGPYGWNAADPGGPTKYGITCWDLAEFMGRKMTSMAEWAPIVRAMPMSTADQIYENKYARREQFDKLNSGPDVCILDFDVNSGTTGIRYAQIVAGVSSDGILGPQSLAAIDAMNPAKFVDALCAQRMRFLRGLDTWGTFGIGWSRRVDNLNTYCHRLITAPMKAAVGERYVEKPERIPLAYGKAFAPEGHFDSLTGAARF